MHTIEMYEAGYCKHPEFMTLSGGSFRSTVFPAMAALIHHNGKNILFDTGYSDHFFDATKRFPEKLYALTTPVTLDHPLSEQVSTRIDDVVISHLHADHIGGLKDFPHARIVCSKEAYDFATNSRISRFSKVKKGVLPALLPDDFERRVTFIEDLKEVNLAENMYPFRTAFELFDGVYLIHLPGHAHGQYGMLTENHFFIADAVWNIKTITEDRKPNRLTRLIMDNPKAYLETLAKLQTLHKNNPDIALIPTHCTQTIQKLKRRKDV